MVVFHVKLTISLRLLALRRERRWDGTVRLTPQAMFSGLPKPQYLVRRAAALPTYWYRLCWLHTGKYVHHGRRGRESPGQPEIRSQGGIRDWSDA
jgi:hypothetical protein